MNYRDFLQKVIYAIINPLIKGMIKIGITPNFITTTGFVLNLVATAMFIYAAELAETEAYAWIGWAGGVILFAGLFDMMDGRLARMAACRLRSAPFGTQPSTATASFARFSASATICLCSMTTGSGLASLRSRQWLAR